MCVRINSSFSSCYSSCCTARAPALLSRSTKSVCRLQRVKACPSSNITFYPEPKDSPPHCSVLRAQVTFTNAHTLTTTIFKTYVFKGFAYSRLFFLLTVTAVYDVTLNFQDNQTPTLLGIVNGKQYKADMSVRWGPLVHTVYFWIITFCNKALPCQLFLEVKHNKWILSILASFQLHFV